MTTPLEIASSTPAIQRGIRASDGEIEAVMAWAAGKITYKQLCAGLGKKHSAGRVAVCKVFKQIIMDGTIHDWLKETT